MSEEAGAQGGAKAAVEHDGPRARPRGVADGELGVIGQDSSDPHKHGVVGGPQPVRERRGFGAAQLQAGAGAGGQASVQALGIAEGDKRAIFETDGADVPAERLKRIHRPLAAARDLEVQW